MIEVKDLKKRYGAFEALRGVSFSVAKGQVVGFLGPNGAGKTTTMKILTGYLLATSGEARIGGLCVRTQSLEVRKRLGYLPESAPLYGDMQVREYLGFCADVRGVASPAKRIAEVAERCSVGDVLGVPIGQLSKGYRQRVGIAQALLHEPELLILDEPTSGLDPNQVVGVRNLLKEIGKEKTIILSTHILREVEATCNRVLIISQGEIVADAPPERLTRGSALVVSGRGAGDALAAEQLGKVEGLASAEPLPGEREPTRFCVRLRGSGEVGDDVAERVFRLAKERNWTLTELRPENASLEEVFHTLTA